MDIIFTNLIARIPELLVHRGSLFVLNELVGCTTTSVQKIKGEIYLRNYPERRHYWGKNYRWELPMKWQYTWKKTIVMKLTDDMGQCIVCSSHDKKISETERVHIVPSNHLSLGNLSLDVLRYIFDYIPFRSGCGVSLVCAQFFYAWTQNLVLRLDRFIHSYPMCTEHISETIQILRKEPSHQTIFSTFHPIFLNRCASCDILKYYSHEHTRHINECQLEKQRLNYCMRKYLNYCQNDYNKCNQIWWHQFDCSCLSKGRGAHKLSSNLELELEDDHIPIDNNLWCRHNRRNKFHHGKRLPRQKQHKKRRRRKAKRRRSLSRRFVSDD